MVYGQLKLQGSLKTVQQIIGIIFKGKPNIHFAYCFCKSSHTQKISK